MAKVCYYAEDPPDVSVEGGRVLLETEVSGEHVRVCSNPHTAIRTGRALVEAGQAIMAKGEVRAIRHG